MSDWLKVNSDCGHLEPYNVCFLLHCVRGEWELGRCKPASGLGHGFAVVEITKQLLLCKPLGPVATEQKPSNSCVRTHLGIQAQRTP